MRRFLAAALLCLAAHSAGALEPEFYLHGGAGFQLYFPDPIPGSDRYVWTGEAGGGMALNRHFAVEAAFRYGGIIFADLGYSRIAGFGLGIFSYYLPENDTWMDNLYVRGGLQFEKFDRMRHDVLYTGLYIAPGISLPFGRSGRFRMRHELYVHRGFPDVDGAMKHWRLGIQSVFTFSFQG